MRYVFVKTVVIDSQTTSVASATARYLRGQYVRVNGMIARIANHTGNRVVLWDPKKKDVMVFM